MKLLTIGVLLMALPAALPESLAGVGLGSLLVGALIVSLVAFGTFS